MAEGKVTTMNDTTRVDDGGEPSEGNGGFSIVEIVKNIQRMDAIDKYLANLTPITEHFKISYKAYKAFETECIEMPL
jgi:hypothetical protein